MRYDEVVFCVTSLLWGLSGFLELHSQLPLAASAVP